MSKISYDALAIEGLKEVFIQISETCKELEIEFFIVGAIARNIWYVSKDENSRGTKDIDFGVYISDVKKYNELRSTLKQKYNYIESTENAFSLITQDNKQIDLLPFGEIEKDGQVIIEGKGLTTINLDGFKEVFEFGAQEIKIGEEAYKSCSIPGMMILKLIAYDDRPNNRLKDIVDVNSICQYYPSLESDFIWANHFDLYGGNLEHEEVGVIVLGREMKKLVSDNKALENRLVHIMDKAINEESALLTIMIQNSERETIAMKKNIIEKLKIGFIQNVIS